MGYFEEKVVSLGFLSEPKVLGKGVCHAHALGKTEPDVFIIFLNPEVIYWT